MLDTTSKRYAFPSSLFGWRWGSRPGELFLVNEREDRRLILDPYDSVGGQYCVLAEIVSESEHAR